MKLPNTVERLDELTPANVLQDDIVHWADSVFPDRTPKDVALKMFEEIGEVIRKPRDCVEYADVVILLLDFAHFYNISAEDILNASGMKMRVNRTRQWDVDADTGIMRHR